MWEAFLYMYNFIKQKVVTNCMKCWALFKEILPVKEKESAFEIVKKSFKVDPEFIKKFLKLS